jgi:hypothetical protein
MKWTDNLPTEKGWYGYRYRGHEHVNAIYVEDWGDALHVEYESGGHYYHQSVESFTEEGMQWCRVEWPE